MRTIRNKEKRYADGVFSISISIARIVVGPEFI
jgi:hypothetical protein